MEPKAHHVLIGAFTVTIAVLAVLAALWLGKAGQNAGERHFVVIFNEAVRGLMVGSAVQYNGIQVGEVLALSLDPSNPSVVRARIKVRNNIPMKQDTRARLVLTGITGASVIGLSGGSPDSPELPQPESGDPIIIAMPSPISQLLANSDNFMTSLTELMVSARHVLSPENAERISQSLANLEQLTAELSGQSSNLPAQVEATLESVQRAMASFESTGKSLTQLVDENRKGLSSGVDGLRQLGPALHELRSTLASLQEAVRKFGDNPSNFLFERTTIEEFVP